MFKKRGQVTIFIIVAVIIVSVVAGFFVVRNFLIVQNIPENLEPVYTSFLSCLEDDVLTGINVLESQGGYIYLPDFESGSSYMPFGSQLDFLGNPIPYWYYVSGNNVQKEQIPSKGDMEYEIQEFVNEKISGCVFDTYYSQGFEISLGEPDSKVFIRDGEVEINLDMDLGIVKGEDSALVKTHKVVVNSDLGILYNSAKKIYNYEQEKLFLENYAVDTMRLYAPVDGVELSCAPAIWNADDVFDELQEAIEVNTLSLKVKGGDYTLKSEENKYFIIDTSVDADVRFINSKDWASSFEVSPTESSVLIASPIGNQEGMGIIGFCYVPYHFVYDLKYPVLIQVYSGEEIFQFPVAVVVQGNKPRQALNSNAVEVDSPQLCEYKNTLVNVNTYDSNLNPVDAEISYECFGERCEIGETEQGSLSEEFPQCVNGYVVAKAEGFEDTRKLYSVTDEGSVGILLDKTYELEVNLKIDGIDSSKQAIITFASDSSSQTIIYPEQKTVELSEGQYEIQVYIYENSSLKLEETSYEQCTEVPQEGLGALFGLTKEKCFDVSIPAQFVSNVLSGGGKESYYTLENELIGAGSIEIDAESLDLPTSIEELQDNYVLFDEKELDINFE